MTTALRRHRFIALLVSTLLFVASPLGAQGAKDSALVRANRMDLDSIARDKTAPGYSKRAQARIRMRDSLFLVRTVTPAPTPAPTPTTEPAPTPTTPPVIVVDSTPTTPPPVVVTPGAPPGPVLFTHPIAPPANGAVLAELPRDTVDVSWPASARRYSCTNLQACLDTAKTGDEVRLAKGASFTDVVVKPTARAGWLTVMTDLTGAELGGIWDRMTPTKADALNVATIRSSGGSQSAITVASGAHHVRFVGVRITTATPTTSLVRIGLGESDPAQLPHHITIDRVVEDPGPAGDVRRCTTLDGAYLAVLSSTLANCHSNRGDSQGVFFYNAKGPLRVENNAIAAGHQSVFSGGADPAIRGQVPADVVIRRNDLSRPLSWRRAVSGVYNAGEWQTKTNVELKIGKRVLIEGNLICHTWPDAQSGYAVLLKTENQDGGTWGDWSETSDITVRYNRICGAGGGFNLSALANGPGMPMSRVAIYGNEADSVGVGVYQGDTGDALQVSGVADVVYQDNWTRNPSGRSCIYSAGVNARFVGRNLVCGGQYGIRGENGGVAVTMPGSILTSNTVVPWGTAFSSWPASPVNAVRDALLAGLVIAP